MKFKTSSKSLYSALSSVSKVISSKNAMTILNKFLIEVFDEKIIVTASDLENTLSATIAISDKDGDNIKFCVDARRMVELCKELPEVDITFEINDNLEVSIDYPGGRFDFIAIPGAEYPTGTQEAQSDDKVEFSAPSEQIIDGIDNTIFAIGTDELRPQMMGIYMDIVPEQITFVATDTRKLVRYINSTSAPGVTTSFILPTKPVNIVRNIFAKSDNISISVDSKSAIFKSEQFVFACRLIKGRFPDYNRVIPQSSPYTLTVDRMSMINAVRRVSVSVDPSHGMIKFLIKPTSIELKTQDRNFGTLGQECIPCSFTGNEMIIGFSAHFIIDIFNTISTDNVIIKLTDAARPGLFVPEEDKPGTELVMLLMPMTINSY